MLILQLKVRTLHTERSLRLQGFVLRQITQVAQLAPQQAVHFLPHSPERFCADWTSYTSFVRVG